MLLLKLKIHFSELWIFEFRRYRIVITFASIPSTFSASPIGRRFCYTTFGELVSTLAQLHSAPQGHCERSLVQKTCSKKNKRCYAQKILCLFKKIFQLSMFYCKSKKLYITQINVGSQFGNMYLYLYLYVYLMEYIW